MNNLEQKIDAIFSRWQQGVCPGGQVVVRRGGELIYHKNFGYANLEHQIPIQDDTVFHVASVSKQLTVMCILLLHEDGKLHIDDDIRQYISDLVKFDEPVTIRHMMNNVSGIRDQWELLGLRGVRIADTITQSDALSLIACQKHLNFQPLSQFLYSNSNFSLLAEIVERLTGKTLNAFATERIFHPLGMTSTCFKESHWQMINHKAYSYFDNGAGRFVYSVLNYGTYGATALNTTALDFLKWMDNYRQPTICDAIALNLMYTKPMLTNGQESSYAGGIFVGDYKGHPYIEHGGADAAYRSAMLRFTEDDVDIIIFSNTQNMLMKDAAFAVANAVFGYEKEALDSEQPQAYLEDFNPTDAEGYYVSISDSLIMAFDIVLSEGQLCLKNQYGLSPLAHVSGNHYRIEQLNLDLYLGRQCALKTKEKLASLQKVEIFKPEDSTNYLGRYQSDELDTRYDVIDKDGALYLAHFRHGEQPLYQVDDNTFVTNAPFTYLVQFIKENESVIGFSFIGNRVKNVLLTKVTV